MSSQEIPNSNIEIPPPPSILQAGNRVEQSTETPSKYPEVDARFKSLREFTDRYEAQRAAELAAKAAKQAEVDAALQRIRGKALDFYAKPQLVVPPTPAKTQTFSDSLEFDQQVIARESIGRGDTRDLPVQYQFDFGNALLTAGALLVVGFAWFAQRRLKWLAARGFTILAAFIRWLHMPPDGKI